MFNPREYLETIKVVIEHRENSNAKTFALVVRNKQILCIPTSHVQQLDNRLRLLSSHILQYGLSSQEWTDLERKVARLQKEGLLL